MKNDWIDRYKVVRRISLAWIVGLITHSTLVIYGNLEAITAAVATVYGITTGLLSVIWGKYFFDRAREDHDKQK